ncbi:tRNA pseudouridine(55) synthase TruB [Paracoccaceae bacterium]|nr:tRNA pseudouridine(55) synthase TruB [Paracoccaceae bacterium]
MKKVSKNKAKVKLDGWLLVNKPKGMTSTDVIRRLKNKLNPAKIGHAGTLDPNATGLLPVAMGEATKAIPYLLRTKKKYKALLKFGLKTDTDDLNGKILKSSSYIPEKDEVLDALNYYSKVPYQTPPKVSAIKVNGIRAYRRFKAEEEFILAPRELKIFKLILKHYSKTEGSTIVLECSKGSYVRSIARDVGDYIGSYGYVEKLCRLEYGPFKLTDALNLSDILAINIDSNDLNLIDIETAMSTLKIFECDYEQYKYIQDGRPIMCSETFSVGHGEEIIAKHNNHILAILVKSGTLLKVKRKFNT